MSPEMALIIAVKQIHSNLSVWAIRHRMRHEWLYLFLSLICETYFKWGCGLTEVVVYPWLVHDLMGSSWISFVYDDLHYWKLVFQYETLSSIDDIDDIDIQLNCFSYLLFSLLRHSKWSYVNVSLYVCTFLMFRIFMLVYSLSECVLRPLICI